MFVAQFVLFLRRDANNPKRSSYVLGTHNYRLAADDYVKEFHILTISVGSG